MAKIVVAVDPDVLDLIPRFLHNKREETKKIAELIDQRNFDTLRALGHKLKGEGGSYGLDAISTQGAAIEIAAAAGDQAALSRCHRELAEYLDVLEVVAGPATED